MRRFQGGVTATKISVSCVLEPGELSRLDQMGRFLNCDRSEVLRRAMICLSAAGEAMFGHLGVADFHPHSPQISAINPHSVTPYTDLMRGHSL